MEIEKRKLGKTGVDVTIMGLGGEGILRTFGYDRQAYDLINRALELGITYFESARAYAGSESYYGKSLAQHRQKIFLTSKSHARDKQGALSHLRETLSNMNTDYLDLWQVHDVRTSADIEEIFGPNGAIEAFVEAKKKGLVRFLGVTGHQDPSVIKRCIEIFDFDTVLIPINPAEVAFGNFIEGVVPIAVEKGMGIIGMKIYLRGLAAKLPWYSTMEPFFRFALSQTISTAVIGCDSLRQLEENVRFAQTFAPFADAAIQEIIAGVGPFARSLMYYKP